MNTFIINQGERLPPFEVTISDVNGPVDLTGAAVLLQYRLAGTLPWVSRAILDPSGFLDRVGGLIRYEWLAGETDIAGVYQVRYVVQFAGGKVQSFPTLLFDQMVIASITDGIYTLARMKAELRPELFPMGEAQNLVSAHDRAFTDALVDLGKWVPCLQTANTTVVPFCSTYFQCGMTVLTAPRGAIKRVSVADRINLDTCLEDEAAEVNWCSEVIAEQVEYCHLQKITDALCQCGWTAPDLAPFCCDPFHFPTPTDAGYEGFPMLPLGFHWPQPSTDSPCGRALVKVWALHRGRIYIAPWLQSSEVVIIEWDGLKRDWNELDKVDNDPLLKRAVSHFVLREHYLRYERDGAQSKVFAELYRDALADIIHQCDVETRARTCEPSQALEGMQPIVDEATGTIPTTTSTTTPA